jgi:hypothetical protein
VHGRTASPNGRGAAAGDDLEMETAVRARTLEEERSHGPCLSAVLGLLGVLIAVAAFQVIAFPNESPVPLVLALVLSLAIVAGARRDEDGSAVVLAWVLRLLVAFGFFRLVTAAGGTPDWAAVYDPRGWELAEGIRAHGTLPSFKFGGGGDNVTALVGCVYAVTGRSPTSVVVLESLCGLVASWVYLHACRLLVPHPPVAVRYGLLFFPSFVFWTTLMGKDPIVSLGLALGVYGAIATSVGRGRTLTNVGLTAAGACLCLLFRPHLVLVFVPALLAGMLFALLWRPWAPDAPRQRPGSRGRRLVVAAALVLGSVLMPALISYGMRKLRVEDVEVNALVERAGMVRASNPWGGGSNTGFTEYASPTDALRRLPQSLGTLIFRPFFWEAHSAAAVVAALDTLLLAGLCVWFFVGAALRWREVWRTRSKPALGFLLAWLAMWTLMFVNITGNLGTMVRHRVQIVPVILLLAGALSEGRRRRRASRAG